MSKKDPKELIIDILKQHSEGLTILTISELTGLHRHTSKKYIDSLVGNGMIFQRNIGPAKLCYLNDLSKIEESGRKLEINQQPDGKLKLKVIAAVILLTFLLSETVILASNISFNETNISGFSTINTSPLTESAEMNNSPAIIEIINQTFENATPIEEPNTEETTTTEASFNETIENETEKTVDNAFIPEPAKEKFSIKLDYFGKVTRGETMTLKAIVENVDSTSSKNTYLRWVIPEGFSVVSGTSEQNIGEKLPGGVYTTEILVKTELSTVLGLNEVKIVMDYEE